MPPARLYLIASLFFSAIHVDSIDPADLQVRVGDQVLSHQEPGQSKTYTVSLLDDNLEGVYTWLLD